MHMYYVVSKSRNCLSTGSVKRKKIANLPGSLSNTSSYNRLTGALAKLGS